MWMNNLLFRVEKCQSFTATLNANEIETSLNKKVHQKEFSLQPFRAHKYLYLFKNNLLLHTS